MVVKVKSPRQEIRKVIILSVLLSLVVWFSFDIIINFSYSIHLEKPKSSESTDLENYLLYYLENPLEASNDNVIINEEYLINAISPVKEYIDNRYDCMDFLMPTLLRLEYLYGDEIIYISPDASDLIKETFINAKYWLTEPGQDNACYWSENHQILYAVSEYMAGQAWPDEVFTNDGTTGREHMERARNRIGYWVEHRYKYGFTEYNSANYIPFNIAPMSNFIQFASEDDSAMVQRMKMVLDLQFYEIASNMFNYNYMAPTARAYVRNMLGIVGDGVRKYTDFVWDLNDDWKDNKHRMLINFISMSLSTDTDGKPYYEVPEVILDIGRDTEDRVIKSTSSLNTSELEEEGLIGQSDEQIMMQFGMESFTNPEVFDNTMDYLSRNNLFTNETFNMFKYFNLSALKTFNLLGPLSSALNPMPNGIALQRANIYTYQTEYYQLATNQAYHPGIYGATQMLSIANFTDNAVVFTTHPARYESLKNVEAFPGYWSGFGRAPHSVQNENILLSIYQLPEKGNITELYDVPQFTHTYLPEAFFDEVIIDGEYAFARVGNAYLSLKGASNLDYLPYDADSATAFRNGLDQYPDKKFDLVQNGLNQYWIYELSDSTVETFQDFIVRIKGNTISYNGIDNLSYTSNGSTLNVQYLGDFTINGIKEDLEYKRFDSDYIIADRKSEVFSFSFNGHTLTLNYNELIRDMT